MFDQLQPALMSKDPEHLRYLTNSLITKVDEAEWHERYDLYEACLALGDRNGCAHILNQLPREGDRRILRLSLRSFAFMELVRTQHPSVANDKQKVSQILQVVKYVAMRTGDEKLALIVDSKVRVS